MAVSCSAASTVVVGMIPVLHLAGMLSFPVLLGAVAVAGALRGPGDAAGHALIPAVVEQTGSATERVTGLTGAVERTASMVGAAVAGGLVALVGAGQRADRRRRLVRAGRRRPLVGHARHAGPGTSAAPGRRGHLVVRSVSCATAGTTCARTRS